jgi:hypothetical protein
MRRLICLAVVAAAVLGIGSARAQGPNPSATGEAHMLGAVLPFSHDTGGGAKGAGQLRYHGGPVMHTNKVYSIYWVPAGYTIANGYRSTIDQFFTDVAADSGKTSNVYWSDTQYTDGSGALSYSSSVGGASVIDTHTLPASGCTDKYTPVCLTDAQIQTEIRAVITQNGWAAGPSTVFFLFTAKGIGSCYGTSCAFSNYCAYHSWIGSGSSVILYANMPYGDTVPAACDAGQHPNGANDADATLNVTSHEHNEAITDPQGNAWWDAAGYENGDKCAWIFGGLSGSSGAQYNQTINGHHYFLQEEYSNQTRNCVQSGL